MTDTNAFCPMPTKVATALAAVMTDVPKLGKGEKNAHGNYNFASIDDFLEAVRPLCAKHGLIIVQDEESFEMREAGTGRDGKPAVWLVMRFRFTLAHTSGETWMHRPARTIMVSASMGSQAFGAAQSYALKQFERSLFQIATGEKDADADAHPPADLPRNGNGTKTGAAISGPIGQLAPKDDQAESLSLAWHDTTGVETRKVRGIEPFLKELYAAIEKFPQMFEANEHTLAWLEKEYPTAKCGRKTVAAAAKDIRLLYDAKTGAHV